MKIRYDETGGFGVWAERELFYTSYVVIPTYLTGEICFSIVEGPDADRIVKEFLVGGEVEVEDRIRTWRTIPTSISYSMNPGKKAMINFRLTIVG